MLRYSWAEFIQLIQLIRYVSKFPYFGNQTKERMQLNNQSVSFVSAHVVFSALIDYLCYCQPEMNTKTRFKYNIFWSNA